MNNLFPHLLSLSLQERLSLIEQMIMTASIVDAVEQSAIGMDSIPSKVLQATS